MMRIFLSIFFAAAVAGGPVSAGLITVNSGDCAAIAAHAPDEDVAYQPGVDAYGNAVAPADLNESGRIDYNVDDIVISIGNPLVATPGVVGDQPPSWRRGAGSITSAPRRASGPLRCVTARSISTANASPTTRPAP